MSGSQLIQIELEKINVLPAFSDPAVIELFFVAGSLLSNLPKYLSSQAVSYLLDLHPIHVIEIKKKGYYCAGGMRTLSVVRNCCLPSKVIPVTLLPSMKEAAAHKRCLADLFLTACLSLRTPESLFRFLEFLSDDLKSELFVSTELLTVSKIAKLLNLNRETIRSWKKKTKPASGS